MNLLALLFYDKNLAVGQNSVPVGSKADFAALLDRLQHGSSSHSTLNTHQPLLPQEESMLLEKSLNHSSFIIDKEDKNFMRASEHTSLTMKTTLPKSAKISQERLLVKSFDKNKKESPDLQRAIDTKMQNQTPLVQQKFQKGLTKSSWYSNEATPSSYKEPLHQSKTHTPRSLYKQKKSTPHTSHSQSFLTQTSIVLTPLSQDTSQPLMREENQQKVNLKKSGQVKDLLSKEQQGPLEAAFKKNGAGQIRKNRVERGQIVKKRADVPTKEFVRKDSSLSHDFLAKSLQEKKVSHQSAPTLHSGTRRVVTNEQVAPDTKMKKSQRSRVEANGKGVVEEGVAAPSIQEERLVDGSCFIHKSRPLEAKGSKGGASLAAHSVHRHKKSQKSQRSGIEANGEKVVEEGIAAPSIQEERLVDGSRFIHKSRPLEAKGSKTETSLAAHSVHRHKKSQKSQRSGIEANGERVVEEGVAAPSIQEDQRALKEMTSPSKELSLHQSGLEDSVKKVVDSSAASQNFQDQNSQSFEQHQDLDQTSYPHTPQELEGQPLEFQKRVLTIRLEHTQININLNANQLNLTFFSPTALHNDGHLGEFIDEVMQQSGFDKYKVTLKDKQKRIEILSKEKRTSSSHSRSVIDVKV